MGSFARARLYIRRNKGKSISLILIMWICLTCALMSGLLSGVSDAAQMQLKEKLSGYFTVKPDSEADSERKRLTDDFCGKIAADEAVLTYNGVDIYYMAVPDCILTPGKFLAEGNEEFSHGMRFEMSTDTEYNENFYLQETKLISGEHIRKDDEGMALVSETFARENGLAVGDIFESVVTGQYASAEGALDEKFSYCVKGIYSVNASEDNSLKVESEIPENKVFVDVKTGRKAIAALSGREIDRFRYGANFYIRDSADFESTVKRLVEEYGLDTGGFELEQNNQKYADSAKPLAKISRMTKVYTLVLAILGAVILCLILILRTRERNNEMGIYLAAGIEKKGILTQLFMESLSLYGAAALAAVPFALLLVPRFMEMIFAKESVSVWGGVLTGVSSGLTGKMIFAVIFCGGAVSALAVVLAFWSVVRMTPRAILAANE